MRSLVSCGVVTLCRFNSRCSYLVNANECAAETVLCRRSICSSRSSLLSVHQHDHDMRIRRNDHRVRMFCTNGDGTGTPTDTTGAGGSVSGWQDARLPRRLIKRLKRQGISESQFLSKLNAEESKPAEHVVYDSFEHRSRPPAQFTGSQGELETLIKDMSVGPKYVSELESFPSDMTKYREIERKRARSNATDSKLKVEPSSTSILLFPGQGSQFVGMGKKLLHFPGVNELYEEASSILGYDLLNLCLNGSRSELDKTIHCQPAVMITSIAALEKLREEHPEAIENCVATAGFSVGEFAALVFSGVLSFPDAIEIVKIRAEAMQKSSERVSSGMLSVFLAHDSDLKSAMKTAKEYCKERRGIREPVCQIANYLFPECKVIAGHTEALDFVVANAKEFRILRTKRLPVSGAFHTHLMESALTPLGNVFKKIKVGVPKLPVYSNLTGMPYYEKTNFGHKLCQQVVKPVKWEQTMHSIYSRPQGADFPQTFEVGPHRQMGTLLKQINLQAHKSYRHIEV